jgi:hypothetical protein
MSNLPEGPHANHTKPISTHRMEMVDERKTYICEDCGINIYRALKERCTGRKEDDE